MKCSFSQEPKQKQNFTTNRIVFTYFSAESPILLDCPRLSNPIVDGNIFKFECFINYSVPISKNADARFLVQFLHDGKPNEEFSVVLSPPETTATLHEYYLMGHMGQYVSSPFVSDLSILNFSTLGFYFHISAMSRSTLLGIIYFSSAVKFKHSGRVQLM